MSFGGRVRGWGAPVAVLALLTHAYPAAAGCIDSYPEATRLSETRVTLKGDGEVRVDLPASGSSETLVYAVEDGVDVELEVRDATGAVLGRGDSPVARIGRQRVFVPSSGKPPAFALVRGREHAGVSGAVTVSMVQVGAAGAGSDCTTIERSLAAADQAYAEARAKSRSLLEAAAVLYQNAMRAIDAQPRLDDRGEVRLTLAALYYYDLQDWARSAQSAEAAATILRNANSAYRRARAQAILVSAWLELATKSSASAQSSDIPADSHALLNKGRALLAQLEAFHRARSEPYDRALQINNTGLAYFYEARFEAAIPYFKRALAEFEKLGETQRVAVATENMALCEWGLGRLSAALPMFDRALSVMPQGYPDLTLLALSNSALAHHGAGRFDDSLRLNGQVIDLGTRVQIDRLRARGYYGMGITYYAIGDHELAARFLRSALEILTPDLDARAPVSHLCAGSP